MTLPKLGDLLPSERVTEGSKRFKGLPSPYFPTEPKTDVPAELKWIPDMLEDFHLKLRKTVLKCALPYSQYPPFEHIDIDVKTTATIAAAATATIVTITVPQHQRAVIRFYGQDIEAVIPPTLTTCWNDIKWTFKRGSFALQYYDAFLGQRGDLINLRETAITIEGPETFTISAENIGAVSYYVTASVIGHQYSILSAPSPKEDILML